jgi:hypothetical protein
MGSDPGELSRVGKVVMAATKPIGVSLEQYLQLCNDRLREQSWFAEGMCFRVVPLGSADPSGVDYVCSDNRLLRLMIELDAALAKKYHIER